MNDQGCGLVFTFINRRRLAFMVPAVSSTLLAALVVACGNNGSANEVVVAGYKFPPISAAPGATLKLVDRDDEPHTVTADDGAFKAGPFAPKTPATLIVPTKPGTYPFHCEIHPTMHGALVVHQP